jgi:hypothetical protein
MATKAIFRPVFGWFCAGLYAICALAAQAAELRRPIASLPETRGPLKPSAYIALPLGATEPEGWLKRQLRI